MNDAMTFSRHKQCFEDVANLFKALIQFGLEISTDKCQFFRDYLAYMGPTFMLTDGKPSCTLMSEIIKLNLPKSLQKCRSFHGTVIFLSSFLKDLRKHLIAIYDIQKNKNKF